MTVSLKKVRINAGPAYNKKRFESILARFWSRERYDFFFKYHFDQQCLHCHREKWLLFS